MASESIPLSIKSLRRATFTSSYSLDQNLIQIASGIDSHRFLTNPASHLIYLYLTRFVQICSEVYWGRSIAELKILDWGCGKGQTSYLLRQLGGNPISCDLLNGLQDSSFQQETPILDQAGISVQGLEHEIMLPYGDQSMDVVLSVGVLEHVQDDQASLQEIWRILKPKGLFFCFFLPQSLSWTQKVAQWQGITYHDRLYSHSKVKRMLDHSGFTLWDFWYRQILPKNSIRYPAYAQVERLDQWITEFTPLRYLATNIEFVAGKN